VQESPIEEEKGSLSYNDRNYLRFNKPKKEADAYDFF